MVHLASRVSLVRRTRETKQRGYALAPHGVPPKTGCFLMWKGVSFGGKKAPKAETMGIDSLYTISGEILTNHQYELDLPHFCNRHFTLNHVHA